MEIARQDHIHFIGIGGISMSGLAHALADQGYTVSGSDRSDSPRLQVLREAGIRVHIGHHPAYVADADVVIYTTAIRETNLERQAAMAAGKPVYHRSEMLAWMLRGRQGIAVSGTHGKTTTTAMIAWILEHAGLDPTAFVGGEVLNWHSNYRLGRGPYVVFEACESDGSFTAYRHCNEVVSCIERDHLDQHTDLAHLEAAFTDFLRLADPGGFLVWGRDCAHLRQLASESPARAISFGLNPEADPATPADYGAMDLQFDGSRTEFLLLKHGRPAAEIRLQVPGAHNVLNALAALAAAEACGVGLDICRAALLSFKGTGRRFELLGRQDGIAVYDDYAHHPTELRAALSAARHFPVERLIAIFQPHLFSRTRDLMPDFVAAFDEADVVIITDIYAAREDPIPGVSAEQLACGLRARTPAKQVLYLPTQNEIIDHVSEMMGPGDLILDLGAGDIREVGEALAHQLTAPVCRARRPARQS